MNPSSDISSSENQFDDTLAKTFKDLNQLVENKDYKAVFKKLFDLALFEPNPLLSKYQRRLISMELLIITKIIFDKILGNNLDNFVFYEENLVEKFNKVIKFFQDHGVNKRDLDRFSVTYNLIGQFVGDRKNNKKKLAENFYKKTIHQDSLKGLFVIYVVFLFNPPNYLKPHLKRDIKKYISKTNSKKPKDLPLLLPSDISLIPSLPSILLGHSRYQLNYLALRKLMRESYKTQDPLSLRSPIKALTIFDSNFLKSPQLFEFFAKMACDPDKKIQFKFYKSLIVNERLSKAFLRFLYQSFDNSLELQSLVELAIRNNNAEFLKTALKFGFMPKLFTKKIGDQELSAKALAIRDGDVEVFKVLFDDVATKIASQTEFYSKDGKDEILSFNDLELAFAYERFDILKYLSQTQKIVRHKISLPPPTQLDFDPSLDEYLLPKQKALKPFEFFDHHRKTFLSFEDYFNNFLIYAVLVDDLDLLKILIIDFENIIKDEYKINALYYAIRLNRPEMLLILVQKKTSEYIEENSQKGLSGGLELIINLDDQLPCQLTPLQLSVLYSSYESMQILLDMGCSISQKSANQESALSLALKLTDIYTLEIFKYCNLKQISLLRESERKKIREQLLNSLVTDLDPLKFKNSKSKIKSLILSQPSKYQNIIRYFYLKTQCRFFSYELIANSIFSSYEGFKKTFKNKEFFLRNKFLRENLLMLLTSVRLVSSSTEKKIEHQDLAKNYFTRATNFNLYCMLIFATDFKPKTQEKIIDNDYTVFLFIDLILSKLCQDRLKDPHQTETISNPLPVNKAKFDAIKDSLNDHFKAKLDDWLDKFEHYLLIYQQLSSGKPICKKIKSKYFQDEDRIVILAMGDFFKIATSLEKFDLDLPRSKSSSGLDYFNRNRLEFEKIIELVNKFCQISHPSPIVRIDGRNLSSRRPCVLR